jgi:hypothetical protein
MTIYETKIGHFQTKIGEFLLPIDAHKVVRTWSKFWDDFYWSVTDTKFDIILEVLKLMPL